MSYILDALKKAEAERKLGAVPGIYAPAADAGSDPRSRRMPWLAGALALLLVMLAALAWVRPWIAPQALPRMPEPVRPASAPPLPPLAAAPAPLVPVTPLVQPPPAKPKAAARIAPPPARPPIASAAPPVAPPQAAQDAGRQDNEPLALRELPEQIQREIPALKIGGYIYSSNPAERSLLINNKLLREGDEVAPGLMLEKMLRGSVVLNYKGYRYRIAY